MKTNYRVPHVEKVEVPRGHVLRVTFDDGLVRELEFLTGSNEGTVFGPLGDPAYFAQVPVNPESRWPNGLDLIRRCRVATSSQQVTPFSRSGHLG